MAKIAHLTDRYQASTSTLSKVWFCAHPDDYDQYFEPICTKILQMQDCLIFYDEEPKAPYDEAALLEDLNFGISLFIIPVTSRLLNEPNRAVDVEFKFAIEHEIAVLPLMQESGLDEKYSEVFGALHYLNAYEEQDGESSYNEKLKKYLDEVLVDRSLGKRILSDFDAMAFLSYRKVDRASADELMRSIHKIDRFRDVGIWYDEFLVPGEDFNEAIKAAIKDSDVFLLALTPHVLNKTPDGKSNYVIKHEYPEAVSNKKNILPVRMAEISQKRLNDKFRPKLPDYIKPHNESMLTQAMESALKHCDLGKNAGRAKHDYLMGLAYLNGIRVEIDRKRAFELIEGAARKGDVEAMTKLVSMYKNAEGVSVDYEKALWWQRRIADKSKSLYEKNQNIFTLENYLVSVFDLIEMMWVLGRTGETEEIHLAALAFTEEAYENMPEDYVRSLLARCHTGLASFYVEHLDAVNINKAEKHALLALDLYEKNAKEEIERFGSEGVFTLKGIARACSLLERVYQERRDERSVSYAQKAVDTMRRVIPAINEVSDYDSLAWTYLNMANSATIEHKYEYLIRSLELFERIAERNPAPENERNVVSVLLMLGRLRQREAQFGYTPSVPSIINRRKAELVERYYGSDYEMPTKLALLKQALEYYSKARSVCKRVVELTGAAADRRNMSHLSADIGSLIKETEDQERSDAQKIATPQEIDALYERVLSYYNTAVDIMAELSAQTGLTEDVRCLVDFRESRGLYLNEWGMRGSGDPQEKYRQALSDYLLDVEIMEKLYQTTGLPSDKANLESTYFSISGLYEVLGDMEKARFYREKSNFDTKFR